MTKVTKPLYPTIHEARDSIDKVLHLSGMLLNCCETMLELKVVGVVPAATLGVRVKALRAAMYGND